MLLPDVSMSGVTITMKKSIETRRRMSEAAKRRGCNFRPEHSYKGSAWFNNGCINIRLRPGEKQPVGFTKGKRNFNVEQKAAQLQKKTDEVLQETGVLIKKQKELEDFDISEIFKDHTKDPRWSRKR